MSKKGKNQDKAERSVVFSTNPETLGDLFKDISIDQNTTEPSEAVVRVHLEKKGRGGKTVSIIRGLAQNEEYLKDLLKELKSSCGSGGSLQDDQSLLIQGDVRDKIVVILKEKGFKNVKKAGG